MSAPMLDLANSRKLCTSATFATLVSAARSAASRLVVGSPATKRAPRVAVTTRPSMAEVAVPAMIVASSWNRDWTRPFDTYWATNTMIRAANRLTLAVRNTSTRSRLGGAIRWSISLLSCLFLLARDDLLAFGALHELHESLDR